MSPNTKNVTLIRELGVVTGPTTVEEQLQALRRVQSFLMLKRPHHGKGRNGSGLHPAPAGPQPGDADAAVPNLTHGVIRTPVADAERSIGDVVDVGFADVGDRSFVVLSANDVGLYDIKTGDVLDVCQPDRPPARSTSHPPPAVSCSEPA